MERRSAKRRRRCLDPSVQAMKSRRNGFAGGFLSASGRVDIPGEPSSAASISGSRTNDRSSPGRLPIVSSCGATGRGRQSRAAHRNREFGGNFGPGHQDARRGGPPSQSVHGQGHARPRMARLGQISNRIIGAGPSGTRRQRQSYTTTTRTPDNRQRRPRRAMLSAGTPFRTRRLSP